MSLPGAGFGCGLALGAAHRGPRNDTLVRMDCNEKAAIKAKLTRVGDAGLKVGLRRCEGL